MNDDDLIAYCETHCETERALFSAEQVNRMFELAGVAQGVPVEGWHAMHDDMKNLCLLARMRNGAKQARDELAERRESKLRSADPDNRALPCHVCGGTLFILLASERVECSECNTKAPRARWRMQQGENKK